MNTNGDTRCQNAKPKPRPGTFRFSTSILRLLFCCCVQEDRINVHVLRGRRSARGAPVSTMCRCHCGSTAFEVRSTVSRTGAALAPIPNLYELERYSGGTYRAVPLRPAAHRGIPPLPRTMHGHFAIPSVRTKIRQHQWQVEFEAAPHQHIRTYVHYTDRAPKRWELGQDLKQLRVPARHAAARSSNGGPAAAGGNTHGGAADRGGRAIPSCPVHTCADQD
ncbi:hypothetical protein C2E23DRAFT_275023 [Lenzites betulinus]|nr:hypothetical protein C2E23DRAFT_275023 [Lenzites betulinus]